MSKEEAEIQNAICEYLALQENMGKLMFWRQNTVGLYDPKTKGYRTPPRYAKNGIPDIIVVKDGFFIGLEVKSRRGQISASQSVFKKLVQDNGGEYHVVRSLDDVIEIGL